MLSKNVALIETTKPDRTIGRNIQFGHIYNNHSINLSRNFFSRPINDYWPRLNNNKLCVFKQTLQSNKIEYEELAFREMGPGVLVNKIDFTFDCGCNENTWTVIYSFLKCLIKNDVF